MATGTVSKPAVRSVWATTVPAGGLTDPGDAFAALGWPGPNIVPPRQYFNWLDNYLFNGVRYQCSRGLPDWDATETFYTIGSVVIGDNGAIYAALQAGPNAAAPGTNVNQAPSTATAYWGSLGVATAAPGDNTNKIASTAFVTAAVGVASATLNAALNAEIAARQAAISGEITARAGGDANTLTSAETYTNAVAASLAPKNSPALTGVPTAPTAAAGNSSQQIATTAFVSSNIGAVAIAGLSGTSAEITTSNTPVFTINGLVGGASYLLELFATLQNAGCSSINIAEAVPNTGDITAHGQFFNLSAQGTNNLFQPFQFNAASATPGLPVSGANPSTATMRGAFTMPAAATSITYYMAVNAGGLYLLAGSILRLTRYA